MVTEGRCARRLKWRGEPGASSLWTVAELLRLRLRGRGALPEGIWVGGGSDWAVVTCSCVGMGICAAGLVDDDATGCCDGGSGAIALAGLGVFSPTRGE